MNNVPETIVGSALGVLLAQSPAVPRLLRNLRLVSKACCEVSDAARDEIQVWLPSCRLPGQCQRTQPTPRQVGGLLSRLPTLTHVAICQDELQDSSGDGQHELCTRGCDPCYCRHCYWRAALSSLQPRHLRRLQLEGLVLLMPAVGGAQAGAAVAGPSAASAVAASSELLAALLAAAPGLQELALLDVHLIAGAPAKVEAAYDSVGTATTGRGPSSSCSSCGAGGSRSGTSSSCGTGLGAVLSALPGRLTSLQLSLSPVTGADAAGAEPCPVCLGKALQRLTGLRCLELSGLRAETALTALLVAISPASPALAMPHPAAPEAPSPPRPYGTACEGAAAATAGAAAAAAQAAPLSALQRLVLDVEGHMDLDQLRRVMACGAMPGLQHLTLVEQQPKPPRQEPRQESRKGRALGQGNAAAGSSDRARRVQGQQQHQHPQQHQETKHVPHISMRVTAESGPKTAKSFLPLDSVLWLLRLPRPDLRRLSFSTDRSFTALPQPLPQLHTQVQAPVCLHTAAQHAAARGSFGASAASASAAAGPSPAPAPLKSVRLVLDLSAEALQPLVSSLPRGLDSLTLHVGALHRPADTLAAMTAAADEEAAAAATPAAAAAATAALGAQAGAVVTGASRSPPPPAPLPPPPPPPPLPPPPPAPAPATAAASFSLLPVSPQPDSPAWLALPPDSFLGGMRWLWPALTSLPALLPALRELRLGGQLPTADHVLRCWAASAGDPASLVTPMVTDPAFNAMVLRSERQQRQQQQAAAVAAAAEAAVEAAAEAAAAAAEVAGREAGGAGPAAGARAAARVIAPRPLERQTPLGAGGIRGDSHGGAAGAATSAAGLPYGMAWSGWAGSLERVCLGSAGPSVSGALHLRRFMPALRRLQVVVDGRLVDVAVAGGGGGGGAGAVGVGAGAMARS